MPGLVLGFLNNEALIFTRKSHIFLGNLRFEITYKHYNIGPH